MLSKEIFGLSKSNSQLSETLKQYNENYRNLQRSLIPPTKLTLNSLTLALSTLSDLGKNVIYKKKESEIRQNQFWAKNFGLITQEIRNRQNEIIKSLPLDAAERTKRIISEIPWTIAVYKKDASGQRRKQSDFLRLPPLSKF